MKTITKKTAILVGIVGVIIVLHFPVFAKTDTAPGQQKKNEKSQNGKQQTASPGQGKSENSQVMTKETIVTKKDAMKKQAQDVFSHKKTKIGTEKLKDLVSKLNSGRSELDTKNVGKIAKVKVAIASQSAQLKRHAVSGIITELADGAITLVHQIHRERTYQIVTNDQTIVTIKGVTAATFSDLAVGQRIAVVGNPTENGLLARRIHVIPGKARGIFEKQPLASPSAIVSTTPSATGEADLTPTVSVTVTSSPTP